MLRAFRSEWIKLRRLLIVAGGASMTLFTVLIVVVIISRAQAIPTRPDQIRLSRLASDSGLSFLLSQGARVVPVIALILVASNVGAEYSQGTLRNLLVREPGRLRLITGKFCALLTFNVLAALVAVAAGIAAAYLVAPSRGIDTSAWTSSAGIGNLGTMAGNLALALAANSVFGLAVALIFRSAAAGVGVAFAWFGIGEQLLVLAYNDFAKVLPGELVSAVRSGTTVTIGTTQVEYLYALAGSGIWVAVALVAGAVLLRTRDVTS